mmetsp:Transcript_18702/g.59611  ORF Transcript_18702/g.59611 Transcript_18702/m.59611 type:complete len:229 (+) Transcript_18702:510-1196(+)
MRGPEGWVPHILCTGSSVMTTSKNSRSRKGTRASTPHAMVDLFARRQSYLNKALSLRTVSLCSSSADGALWKYRYPAIASSEPSPESTILTPMALILRLMRYMGVDARMVVTSYVSVARTTSDTASRPSCTEYTNEWCAVPRSRATSSAKGRSGESRRPMEKECMRGHHACSFSSASTRLCACRAATDATRELSSPPDSRTPHGTSLIRRFTTARSNAKRTRCSTSSG